MFRTAANPYDDIVGECNQAAYSRPVPLRADPAHHTLVTMLGKATDENQ